MRDEGREKIVLTLVSLVFLVRKKILLKMFSISHTAGKFVTYMET